jgi:hypothetical protein
MLCSQNFIVLLVIQCCLAFHVPQQRAGLCPSKLYWGLMHGTSNHFRSKSLQALPADTGDDEVSKTQPITAGKGVGDYDFERKLGLQRQKANVGAPQTLVYDEDSEIAKMNITQVMTELQAIQSQGPKKYCILGTRHCSFLHQQIVEML